jgi:hypothetical protein
MSQPVKLSDELVLDARIAAETQERSIAGQVEFWAKLGRSVELMLDGQQVLTLCRTVGATPLADLVDLVDTLPGREMLKTYLDSEPYPHFEAHPSQAGLLVRAEENGVRTVGRFVNRTFVVVDAEAVPPCQSLSTVNLQTTKKSNKPNPVHVRIKAKSARKSRGIEASA